MSELMKILGSKRTDEIKDAIRDIIIEQVKEDLSQEYMIDSCEVQALGNEIIEQVKEEIREEIKKKVRDAIGEAVQQKLMKEYNL